MQRLTTNALEDHYMGVLALQVMAALPATQRKAAATCDCTSLMGTATDTVVLQVYDLGKDGTGKPSELYTTKDLAEAARNNTKGDWTAHPDNSVVTLVSLDVAQILLADGGCAGAVMSAALPCDCLWMA